MLIPLPYRLCLELIDRITCLVRNASLNDRFLVVHVHFNRNSLLNGNQAIDQINIRHGAFIEAREGPAIPGMAQKSYYTLSVLTIGGWRNQ